MLYKQTFKVISIFGFPIDMLRYDQCWPRTANDSHAIQLQKPGDKPLEVELERIVENKGDKPTEGRWASYNCEIGFIETVPLRLK